MYSAVAGFANRSDLSICCFELDNYFVDYFVANFRNTNFLSSSKLDHYQVK